MKNTLTTTRLAALALAAGLVCFSLSLADHRPGHGGGGGGSGGGGGGAGSNGGGTIYFRYLADLYTMNDDGSGQSLFTGFDAHPDGPYGEPSRELHNGKRWCITLVWPEDYFLALSDAGDVVPLFPQPGLEIIGAPRWGVGDALISFEGVQWDTDPESPTYGQRLAGGLYTLFLTADAEGNLAGGAGPAELVFERPLVLDPIDNRVSPDLRNHDWAPDGTQFVFDVISSEELRIGDVSTGEDWLLIDASAEVGVGEPKWSPAGDRIMFYLRRWGSYPEVALVNTDGSNVKTLVRGSPNGSFVPGVWSPTGSHLVVRHFDNFLQDHYLLRMTASGSAKTRLTGRNAYPAAGFGPIPTGWRE
jgi:hypothetical protein